MKEIFISMFHYAKAVLAAILLSLCTTSVMAYDDFSSWTNTQAKTQKYFKDVLARADSAWGYPQIITSNHYQYATTNRVWTYGGTNYTMSMPLWTNQVMTNAWNVGTNVFQMQLLKDLDQQDG